MPRDCAGGRGPCSTGRPLVRITGQDNTGRLPWFNFFSRRAIVRSRKWRISGRDKAVRHLWALRLCFLASSRRSIAYYLYYCGMQCVSVGIRAPNVLVSNGYSAPVTQELARTRTRGHLSYTRQARLMWKYTVSLVQFGGAKTVSSAIRLASGPIVGWHGRDRQRPCDEGGWTHARA